MLWRPRDSLNITLERFNLDDLSSHVTTLHWWLRWLFKVSLYPETQFSNWFRGGKSRAIAWSHFKRKIKQSNISMLCFFDHRHMDFHSNHRIYMCVTCQFNQWRLEDAQELSISLSQKYHTQVLLGSIFS